MTPRADRDSFLLIVLDEQHAEIEKLKARLEKLEGRTAESVVYGEPERFVAKGKR